jgi:adenine-specific DNA-methyltransferase
MEGYFVDRAATDRPWQGDLCQFFTREEVARVCLRQLRFPRDPLSLRLLEPAAGHGAFIIPLIPRLVRACRSRRRSWDALRPVIRAFEIDPVVAASLRRKCATELRRHGLAAEQAGRLVRSWIQTGDFLEKRITTRFSHIVGNPPYIRWDAVPEPLRDRYRERFSSFKQRADLYVAFIQKSLSLLQPTGQLGLLCPGNWTRNVYGGSVREALTSTGYLKSIIDFSDVESFETPADAYPHFFVFQRGRTGLTKLSSMRTNGSSVESTVPVARQFAPSASPLTLNVAGGVASAITRARKMFPSLEKAGCIVRVGSATGCNDIFLRESSARGLEPSRLVPFVNARSINDGKVTWTGTKIVNVFDRRGKPVDLSRYPKLNRYLQENKKALKARAKASQSKTWWRSIDALHPDWYDARKLLIVDISAVPVIGLDMRGYCAGGGVYQIKSKEWPLRDLWVLLSAGVLGLFVAGLASGSTSGFHRFQKRQIASVPLPRWRQLDKRWRTQFREAYRSGDRKAVLKTVAELYDCDPAILARFVARDWDSFLKRPAA